MLKLLILFLVAVFPINKENGFFCFCFIFSSVKLLFFFYFLKKFIHLKELKTEEEIDLSNHWFPLQMPAVAMTVPGQSQEPHPGVSHGWWKLKHLGPSLLLCQAVSRELH